MNDASPFLDFIKDPGPILFLLSLIGALWVTLRWILGLRTTGRITERKPLLSLVGPAWPPIIWIASKLGLSGLSDEMRRIQKEQYARVADIRAHAEREGLDSITRVYGTPLPYRRTSLVSEIIVVAFVSTMAAALAAALGFAVANDNAIGFIFGVLVFVIIGTLLLKRILRRGGRATP